MIYRSLDRWLVWVYPSPPHFYCGELLLVRWLYGQVSRDRQTDRQTYRQTDRQTDRQTVTRWPSKMATTSNVRRVRLSPYLWTHIVRIAMYQAQLLYRSPPLIIIKIIIGFYGKSWLAFTIKKKSIQRRMPILTELIKDYLWMKTIQTARDSIQRTILIMNYRRSTISRSY